MEQCGWCCPGLWDEGIGVTRAGLHGRDRKRLLHCGLGLFCPFPDNKIKSCYCRMQHPPGMDCAYAPACTSASVPKACDQQGPGEIVSHRPQGMGVQPVPKWARSLPCWDTPGQTLPCWSLKVFMSHMR
jgi:hypothetical protein